MKFSPAWWLANPHLQTLWAPLRRTEPRLLRRRERMTVVDDDFIDLFWCGEWQTGAPLTVLIHGLTGSADSHYIRGLQHTLLSRGEASVALQLRGAGQEPNRQARMYHSGDTADFDAVIRQLVARGARNLRAAGFSLGGNVLLKWLGEQGGASPLSSAVAVSVPFQLGVVADCMNRSMSRIYRDHMLRELKASHARKQVWARQHSPSVLATLNALGPLDKLTTFRAWDNAVVAPLNGFASADDYYARCSSRSFLPHIRTRTLIIHSLDDPLMHPSVIPGRDELPAHVELEAYERGGHVGFVGGSSPRRVVYWLDNRVADALQSNGPSVDPTRDDSIDS